MRRLSFAARVARGRGLRLVVLVVARLVIVGVVGSQLLALVVVGSLVEVRRRRIRRGARNAQRASTRAPSPASPPPG